MTTKQIINKVENWRTVKFETEARVIEGEGKKLILRGYPILFNTPTRIKSFWDEWEETISPNALDNTDLSNVYLLVGHNPDNVLGRAGINMRFEVDETGLFFECELPNTQYARDWYNLVESGIVDGMSFGFNSEGDTWTEPSETQIAKRTINKISKLWEITITPFPAYDEASVVAKGQRTEDGEKTETTPNDAEDEAAKKARADLENKLKLLEAM